MTVSWRPVCSTEFEGIALSPDTTHFAFGLEVDHYRESYISEFFKYDRCDFELYTYDLAHRKGPTRIGSWRRKPDEKFHLQLWDQNGIVLGHEIAHNNGTTKYWVERRSERVQRGLSGSSLSVLAPAEAKRTYEAWESTNPSQPSQDQRGRFHVDEMAGQLFLWHPDTYERELLFSLPEEYQGHRDVSVKYEQKYRQEHIYSDQIQQIRDVSAHSEIDSVRIVMRTYVPRPGNLVRLYWIRATLDVPDTVAAKNRVFQSVDISLPDQVRVLGPRPETIEYAIAYSDLRRMLIPSLKALHWEREGKHEAWMWIRLVPKPLATDPRGERRGRDGAESLSRIYFDVPLR